MYDKARIDACYDYAVFFLNGLSPATIDEQALFWGIDPDLVQDWFSRQSPDHVRQTAFKDLTFFNKRRVVCNACATYYAERLMEYSRAYTAASDDARLNMREQRVVLQNRVPQSYDESRQVLADSANITPLKRPNHILNVVRKQLREKGIEWADSFISPTVNKQERLVSEARRDNARAKGVVRTDLTRVIDWALATVAKRSGVSEPQLTVALGVLGGRRQVELVSPKYVMEKVGKHRVRMSGQAKQVNDKPVLFDTICTATVFIRRIEALRNMRDFTQNNNVFSLQNKCATYLRGCEAFADLREKYLAQYDRFVVHDLRKVYVAYLLWTMQRDGKLPMGEEHRLEYIQLVLGHSTIESSRTYNRLTHVQECDSKGKREQAIECLERIIERRLTEDECALVESIVC